jgi:hypothetical protein
MYEEKLDIEHNLFFRRILRAKLLAKRAIRASNSNAEGDYSGNLSGYTNGDDQSGDSSADPDTVSPLTKDGAYANVERPHFSASSK